MKKLKISTKVTNRENASFKQYLKDISEIDVFKPEEELICTDKASRGDKAAIDELVRRNLRFVVSVAKRYATPQSPLEDLVNEGNIGLITAAHKFKPDMGFKFISYAVWWIRKIIMEHLTKYSRLIRLPPNRINSLSKLDKMVSQLEQKLGRSVDISDIIDAFGGEFDIDDKVGGKVYDKVVEEYNMLSNLNSHRVDSMDRDISGDDNNNTTLSDTLADDNMFKPTDHSIMVEDTKTQIANVLGTLRSRDRDIIIALYGLDGQPPRTLKDMGDEMGVTREMIRQIHQKVLGKLKKHMKHSQFTY